MIVTVILDGVTENGKGGYLSIEGRKGRKGVHDAVNPAYGREPQGGGKL